nr:hypothetical protein [uncultured Flavobacterium sp.]
MNSNSKSDKLNENVPKAEESTFDENRDKFPKILQQLIEEAIKQCGRRNKTTCTGYG